MFGRGRSGSHPYWSNDCPNGPDRQPLRDWSADELAEFGLARRDWRQIDDLLHQADNQEEPEPGPDWRALATAVDSLARSTAGQEYVSAAAVTNGLLDLWAALGPGGGGTTRSVERLLTALPQRHLVATSEITPLLDEARSALAVQA